MITLIADAAYGYGGKQFVARITGRHPKFTFAYTFIGRKEGKRNDRTTAEVDEPGLYVVRDIDRKGNVDDGYRVVVPADDGVKAVRVDKETAMKLAKMLDAGRDILECVDEDGNLITPRQAEQRATAQTIDSAVAACWSVLQSLPEKEAKKVLAQLRARVSPPKTAPVAEETPVGVLSDMAQENGIPEAQLGLTPTPVATFAAGDKVECLDDSNGANFLVAGQTYEVVSTQTDDQGSLRLNLAGMARAWEASRFRRCES